MGGQRELQPVTIEDVARGWRDRVASVVAADPDAPAVFDEHRRLSFGEVARRGAALADAVEAAFAQLDGPGGTDLDEPIAVVTAHDAPAVATLLGTLLSQHPVLVLDGTTPAPRSADRLRRLDARICVTDAACADLGRDIVAEVGGRLVVDADLPLPDDWSAAPAWTRPMDLERIGALGFTSGSTGNPKAVALDHRHLIGDGWAAASVDDAMGPDDVMAHTLPMGFAAGMNATMTGLVSGACMAMFDTRARGIGALAPWIEQEGITVLSVSPAILRAIVNTGPTAQQLRSVRTLTIAGEAAHPADVRSAQPLLRPDARIFVRIGSTETGLLAQLVVGAREEVPDGHLSVGPPSGTTRVRLVDAEGAQVAPGESGTVEVSRREYLASGYWRDPERTAPVFRTEDGWKCYLSNDLGRFDEQGHLHIIGRRDHSLKIRGYLVEPGDVDVALFALPEVTEAVTVGVPRPEGNGNRLVAYVVSRADRPNAASIRAELRKALPAHMVPEAIVFLDRLPRNERGKIDRTALPEAPAPVGGEEPRTEWEVLVASVWARALEVDNVARDADFFELGGDSLAAEAVVSATIADLGVPADRVDSATLVEAPTVAQFALRVRREPSRERETLTVLRSEGDGTPMFFVAGGGGLGVGFVPIARHLPPGRPVYALHAKALERRGLPDWSVRAIARRHIATMREIRPHGPYLLGGHSFGGVVAFEIAQQLRAAGEEVGLLAIIDSFTPDPDLLPPLEAHGLVGRTKDLLGLAVTGIVPTPGVGQYWRFHRQSHTLSRRYRSQPYDGRTLVLVAESPEHELRRPWAPHLTGRWELHDVAGDHQAVLREPYARRVAQLIAEGIAAAEGTGHELGSPARGAGDAGGAGAEDSGGSGDTEAALTGDDALAGSR